MNDDTGTGTAAPTRAQVHASVTFDRLMAMLESGNEGGCCITCGADAPELGPEAADRRCAACGARTACGAEELMIRTLFHAESSSTN